MRTIDDLYSRILSERDSGLGCHHMYKFLQFFPHSKCEEIGMGYGDDKFYENVIPYNIDMVMLNLRKDIDSAFDNALNRRCIMSSIMFGDIKNWMWVMEDDLYKFSEYSMYGLPLYKAVALKYNFTNPIGEDYGSENHYDSL